MPSYKLRRKCEGQWLDAETDIDPKVAHLWVDVTPAYTKVKFDVLKEMYPTASYVCETTPIGEGDRIGPDDVAGVLMYEPNPPPLSPAGRPCTNWFTITNYPWAGTYVGNGQPTADRAIQALIVKSGEVLYSREVHDCRYSQDGSVFIDGGRHYTRIGGDFQNVKQTTIKVVNDHLEIEFNG